MECISLITIHVHFIDYNALLWLQYTSLITIHFFVNSTLHWLRYIHCLWYTSLISIHLINFHESGWAEPGGDLADYPTSTQGAETVPAASSQERGGVPAAGQGKTYQQSNNLWRSCTGLVFLVIITCMFTLKFDRLSTSSSAKCPLYKDVSTDTCRLKESCLLMDQKKIRR